MDEEDREFLDEYKDFVGFLAELDTEALAPCVGGTAGNGARSRSRGSNANAPQLGFAGCVRPSAPTPTSRPPLPTAAHSLKQAKEAADATVHGQRKRPGQSEPAPAEDDDEVLDRPRSFAVAAGAQPRESRLPVKGKDGVLRPPTRQLERPEAAGPAPPVAADEDSVSGDEEDGADVEDAPADGRDEAGQAPWIPEGEPTAPAVSPAAHREACKVQLAALATEILEDPETKVGIRRHAPPRAQGDRRLNPRALRAAQRAPRRGTARGQVDLLKRLQQLAREPDLLVQRLAWLTQLAVFKDIIPGSACSATVRRVCASFESPGSPTRRRLPGLVCAHGRGVQVPYPNAHRGRSSGKGVKGCETDPQV